MTIGHPRRWPGYPHHTGLISAAMTDVIATYSSNPRFRHQLSSDPASRRTPLPRRMVPVITVHRGLTPLERDITTRHTRRNRLSHTGLRPQASGLKFQATGLRPQVS